ncbi:gfo/Idh/MocA family oxidoreductase [uncultured Rikenella sp.]|uniref:gfo/Idh/MocA family oxidoreductase n=1 Tax=uncultured Rikenella sp. TaxID=368003 RepID=UPI00262C7703|nr:gfo/Idh/MocA family oxidoreductase [uncultured Rikenella sp.]
MIWLIGVGNMGCEYAKVLAALHCDYIAVGRGEASATAFESNTGHPVVRGGLDAFLTMGPCLPDAAIVAVGIDQLASTASSLMEYGVRKILLEKPGIGALSEIYRLCAQAKESGSEILLAYNRRFYASVFAAERIIAEDNGVVAFNFEFTEWTHTLDPQKYAPIACRHWLLGNSSHVIDTAFFLGGQPMQISCYRAGEDNLSWHPTASIFAGAGMSDRGALFTYQAAWQSPGRWVIEVLTRKHRLYFKPMETLQLQNIGSVAVNPVEIDNRLDVEYKPGFYLQTKAFVEGDYSRFCTVEQQKEHIEKYYKTISGYVD